ncbi:hypothetical protein [Natrinema marinum]|uniref:hypothetical protein n=1 Tax=Natrinema marinum TaxID=2961598 RepID=UPI0020C8EAD3|nr:hypothetical protein [Natrinema marinum]
MTEYHDHDAATNESIDEFLEREQREEPAAPIESATAAAADAHERGTLPLVGGGLLLAAAIRSLAANRPRAIPLGIAGSGLIGYGLRKRRSSREEEASGPPTVADGIEDKETSDEASAAAERVDAGRVSEIEPDGEIAAEPAIDEAEPGDSEIEFTDEHDRSEPRSSPTLESETDEDPRRETEADEIEIDVSDPAMAEEESEATGPDPEQAQPTRTEDTEPEESPAEDASHMKVDPPDGDEDAASTDDEETTAGDDESGDVDEHDS